MNPTYRSLGLGSTLAGLVLFGAGYCASDTIRYASANARADNALPRVRVEYKRSGTFVNGEPVAADGRIGAPRCDWKTIDSSDRTAYTLEGLREQPGVLASYVRERGSEAWRALMNATVDAQRDIPARKDSVP